MDFSFSTPLLRDVFEKKAAAVSTFGEQVSEEFLARIADLEACDNVSDFLTMFGDDATLQADRLFLRLGNGREIVFGCGHVKKPKLENGLTDWSKVKRLRILDIGGTNG